MSSLWDPLLFWSEILTEFKCFSVLRFPFLLFFVLLFSRLYWVQLGSGFRLHCFYGRGFTNDIKSNIYHVRMGVRNVVELKEERESGNIDHTLCCGTIGIWLLDLLCNGVGWLKTCALDRST